MVEAYIPIELDSFFNAGLELLEQGPPVPLGDQALRGIPFALGSDPARCLVSLAGGRTVRVVFPEPMRTRYVVVAHRLTSSSVLRGGLVGMESSVYVVQYEDGETTAIPIRERLEIGIAPSTSAEWGQMPMLAVPDRFDALPPRISGAFADTGYRLTAVTQPPVRAYLWSWANPNFAKRLRGIEFRSSGQESHVVVAGVTLSLLEEHPLRLPPASPVVIRILGESWPNMDDVAVTVDRGVAGYVYPTLRDTDGAAPSGLPDSLNSPVGDQDSGYCYVAATDSATLLVTHGDRVLASTKWGELTDSRAIDAGSVRIEVVEQGRTWVRTRVLDDSTRSPIPCRIRFVTPGGVPYQPAGHHDQVDDDLLSFNAARGIHVGPWNMDVGGDVRLGHATYAYIDGRCEGWLPVGTVLVELARGFEYEPVRQVVDIVAGQRELDLRLRRWSDLRRHGWYSGDTHVHFLSVDGSHLEAEGEDLDVVNLMATQWGRLFTNFEDFTGRPDVSPSGRSIVHVGQENRQHLLGHLLLLGLRTPVYPVCSDGSPEAELGGALETTLSDWADRCHEQGGLVIMPHFPNPNGEPPALVATERADGAEFTEFLEYAHDQYYRYLNCGFTLPLVGGTDKMSNEVPVGLFRTYVRLMPGEELSYAAWCNAIRRGRTFMSSGPLLSLLVDGNDIGEVVRLGPKGGVVEAHAVAESIFPIQTLQIVVGGRVVASVTEEAGTRTLMLKERVSINKDTWIAARVAGKDYTSSIRHRDEWQRAVMGHTSPIYITCRDQWSMHDVRSASEMLSLLDGALDYLRGMSPRWAAGRASHHHGLPDHLAYLERPFLEARDAILRRAGGSGASDL